MTAAQTVLAIWGGASVALGVIAAIEHGARRRGNELEQRCLTVVAAVDAERAARDAEDRVLAYAELERLADMTDDEADAWLATMDDISALHVTATPRRHRA